MLKAFHTLVSFKLIYYLVRFISSIFSELKIYFSVLPVLLFTVVAKFILLCIDVFTVLLAVREVYCGVQWRTQDFKKGGPETSENLRET